MTAPHSEAPSGLLAQSASLLIANDYRQVLQADTLPWPTPTARVFEDAFGVVGVAVFDTWDDLATTWIDAQAAMVELLSKHISSSQPKSWEGYLVLLTPGSAGSERHELEAIRYDVSRLRKFVADSIELEELGALQRLLAPLLPVTGDPLLIREPLPALELLRRELGARSFPDAAVSTLLNSFEEQAPLVDALDTWRRRRETG